MLRRLLFFVPQEVELSNHFEDDLIAVAELGIYLKAIIPDKLKAEE